jgi:hypothetical protein
MELSDPVRVYMNELASDIEQQWVGTYELIVGKTEKILSNCTSPTLRQALRYLDSIAGDIYLLRALGHYEYGHAMYMQYLELNNHIRQLLSIAQKECYSLFLRMEEYLRSIRNSLLNRYKIKAVPIKNIDFTHEDWVALVNNTQLFITSGWHRY